MRLALIPLNPTVGAIDHNAHLAAQALERAASGGADLAVLPELTLCGYPPKDLLLHESFVERCIAAAHQLAAAIPPDLTAIVGTPWRVNTRSVANALVVLRNGQITHRYHKRLLPTYDVFDEDRYFTAGSDSVIIEAAGARIGLTVCEDLWRGADARSLERYEGKPDPVAELAAQRIDLLVNPSASPFVLGKQRVQESILQRHCRERKIAVAAVNQLGGNDELIFDGRASVYIPDANAPAGARLVGATAAFSGDTLLLDLPTDSASRAKLPAAPDPLNIADEATLWRALVLGTRDYCRKTGFQRAVLGVSGGIDSALAACIAAAALGPANVRGLAMPARFSSKGSITDARALCENLGVPMHIVPIEDMHKAAESSLHDAFAAQGLSTKPDITDENIQSRLRGLTVMAFSNKTGALPITTGNKSELAVGYCTLYGDMNGGLAVLSDVTKKLVYQLARWINANFREAGFNRAPIPTASITKPPSAELRPDQTDQDSLPPYDTIDEIVRRYVELHESPERIAREAGIDPDTVARIVRLIDTSEFKRKQAAIGLKVSSIAFGSGRRFPIAQRWRA